MTQHTPAPWRVYKGWVHPNFDGLSPQATNGDTAICEPLGPDRAANARLITAAVNSYDKHCGSRAVECAEGDLLGELLEALDDAAYHLRHATRADHPSYLKAVALLAKARES